MWLKVVTRGKIIQLYLNPLLKLVMRAISEMNKTQVPMSEWFLRQEKNCLAETYLIILKHKASLCLPIHHP